MLAPKSTGGVVDITLSHIEAVINAVLDNARKLLYDVGLNVNYMESSGNSRAVVALHEFFIRNGNTPPNCIIGPLESTAVDAVLQMANHWNVPVITPGGLNALYHDHVASDVLTRVNSPNYEVFNFFKYLSITGTYIAREIHHVYILVDPGCSTMTRDASLDFYELTRAMAKKVSGKEFLVSTLIDENEAMDSFMRLKTAHNNQLLLRGLQPDSTQLPPVIVYFGRKSFLRQFLIVCEGQKRALRDQGKNVIYWVDFEDETRRHYDDYGEIRIFDTHMRPSENKLQK